MIIHRGASLTSLSQASMIEKSLSSSFLPTLPTVNEVEFVQVDENDPAQLVVLHDPCLPNWMGSIHPNGSLYELPVDVVAAKKEHDNFRRELEKNGCVVKTVKEMLLQDCENNLVARVQLEDFAFKSITYTLETGTDPTSLTDTDRFYLSDQYKKECVDKMNNEQLVEVILTKPEILLRKAAKNTELQAVNYSFSPLVNLVFTRDQQLTTAKGIVMASLAAALRAPEVEVMKFCFEKLKFKIVGQIPLPGTIEGGDFFPAGKDLCFIGIGLRSNMFAVRHMLDHDLFGTTRVAVVKDYFDQDQQRMHLDTICNLVNKKCMIVLETTIGADSPLCRLVDEYKKDQYGVYRLHRHDIEYSQYLKDEGYNIIPVSDRNQRNYGCNGLNLGNGNIIAVDKETSKMMARSHSFDGKITVIDFKNMTNMYGSVHCCSQVVSRRRPVHTNKDRLRLLQAISEGDLELVRMLAETTDLDFTDYDRRAPLHIACSNQKPQMVAYLINEGINVNTTDLWGKTPLDDAIGNKNQEIIDLLKRAGGVTGLELAEKKKCSIPASHPVAAKLQSSQASNRVVMMAPNNFHVNLSADNPWMKNSQNLEKQLEKVRGRRQILELVMKEFRELHRVVTSFGVEVYLFTHDAYMNTPDAVFIQDWFSTHFDDADEPTVVVYALKNPMRRLEKRSDILEFLSSFYSKCINFSPLETGQATITNDFSYKFVESDVEGKYLEFGALVPDRKNKVVYVTESQRADLSLAQEWAQQMKYELVSFQSKAQVHHTDNLLTIGTTFVLMCYEAISTEEELVKVKSYLEEDKSRVVIDIRLDQVEHHCANVMEFIDRDGKTLVVVSKGAFEAFTEDQINTLRSSVDNLVPVDIHTLETLGGGTISALFNSLF